MSEIDDLIGGYYEWLRDKSATKILGEWTEITTPYLDRHNDYIQIYAKKTHRGFVITDGGETLMDLEQSGCLIDSPRRQGILRAILNGFGVEHSEGEFRVLANRDDFPIRKHNLIQAVLSVQDMFYLASATVESIFLEDVSAWMENADIRYTPRIKFSGKSGFDFMFDFVIPKSKLAPERIIRAINNPSASAARNLIFAWLDTKAVRPANSEPFAFLNDNEKVVSSSVTGALWAYGITPIVWSERDQFLTRLAV